MKTAFLVFSYKNGENLAMPLIFHTLLFANEMVEKGDDVKIILEGEGVLWAKDLLNEEHPLKGHFEKLKDNFVVCEACAVMFNIKDEIKDELTLENKLKGHISLKEYIDNGYTIIKM